MVLIFATENQGKLREAQAIIKDIIAPPRKIHLPELQGIETRTIIASKLEIAVRELHQPVVVEDTGLFFHAFSELIDDIYHGLPGPFIRWYLATRGLGVHGLYKWAKDSNNMGATAVTTIGYASSAQEFHFFEGKMDGTIVSPRGSTGFGWDPIFQPNGYDRTLAEMTMEEKNTISMRAEAFRKLKEFLEVN